MAKIIGNTTATPYPHSDWNQADKTKADYIKNKPVLGTLSAKDEVVKTDLSTDIQVSLSKADTAVQSIDGLATEKYVNDSIAEINISTDVYVAEYGVTTFDEIIQAVNEDGKTLLCRVDDGYITLGAVFTLAYCHADGARFVGYTFDGKKEALCSNTDEWSLNDAADNIDVPVTSVNGKTGAVSLNASDVGALSDTTKIPSKVSELTNDSGFITGYTETDPTVPSWAKQTSKPSYSKGEVGLGNVDNVKQYSAENPPPYPVTSVNGKTGAVTISIPNLSGYATETYVKDYAQPKGDYITSIPLDYVTETELSDKGYATENFVAQKIAEAELSGSDVDLSGYATKDEVESKVDKVKGKSLVDDAEIARLADVDNYDDAELKRLIDSKANTADIPTKVSELDNDSNYLTSIPDEYVTEVELNQKGYLTEHQDISNLATKDEVNEKANTSHTHSEYLTSVPSDYKTKTENDSLYQEKGNYLTSYTETDPTVPSWAKASTKPTYTASEVGALPNTTVIPEALSDLTTDSTHRLVTDTEKSTWNNKANTSDIPTKVSQLTNDSGFISSYTETDPTVPSWAKASTKPTYTKSEVGLGNVDNVKQYSASNPPPYPVTKVNGKTGDVALSASDVGAAEKNEGSFFIEGSGTTDSTTKTSTWVGTSDRITEYYDGLSIKYKIGVAGQSTTTLNINGLGAKTVYLFNTTKLTTQFPVKSIINLIYHADLNSGCWVCSDYDSNTNTYQRVYSSTDNIEYPITARYNTTTGSSYYAEYGRYNNEVTLNPSTKTITAAKFKGDLAGNADTATKATHDADGNVITGTYETKTSVASKISEINSQISQLSSEIVDLPNNELLVQNVAQKVPYVKVVERPVCVNSIAEMTDTSKVYVLNSDGMIYSYKAHTTTTEGETTPNFTNQVPISTDTDGSIFNGTGYKEDVRLSSSGGISGTALVGSVTTGFMPYVVGSTIRIKGAEFIGAKEKYGGHYYITFYDADGQFILYLTASLEDYPTVLVPSFDEINGVELLDTSGCIGNTSGSARNLQKSTQFRINAYGKGENLIVTVNEEITYTTTEGGTTTTYTWESTGISYNQPADYEGRVIIAEADIDRLEDKSEELTNRVAELEENSGTGDSGDDESCYDVQMNRLYTDSVIKENTALNNALETLCNRRDGNPQSRQVITLKKNAKQKLILHLHKRENDGYDTTNDVYLPNAQNDFSDVRITTDTGKVLKYQTVYSGNIDVISDSRLGNSDVSFLSDDNGNLYIGRDRGVYKSTDAGKTWSKINGITESVVHVAYVCGDGTLFFGNSSGVLFKSAPPYTTSKAVIDTSEGGLYTGLALRPFQFVQLPTGEMLLGSYQSQFAPRIWKSTNNGETWTKIYEVIGGTYQHVHRMYVDTHQTPAAVYIGLDRGQGERTLDTETGLYYHTSGTVLKSTDGGSTWIDLYENQKGKPQAVDHGVIYADNGYRLLGGETGIVGGSSIVRTTDDINFTAVLTTDHAVYGPEKLNGYLFAGGCGSGGGTSATLYISDDEGVTWKQIYSEEPNAENTLASAGIKTFCKGVFAGTTYEQLIAHNNCSSAHRPSKRIFADENSWYAEIIVDVPNGTNSITVESGYMCPNLSVINNDAENAGDAVFVMDFNENGRYIKEKVSGEIYKGDHVFTNGGKHLGYIYPDVKSATDMNSIKIKSSIFDRGITKKLNLNASELGVTISFWLNSTVNGTFEIISDGSNILHFDGMYLRCNTRHIGTPLTSEGGRFVKMDIVFDIPNNLIKSYKNGICENEITDQTKIDLVASLLTGEKYYTLLKRSSDDDITAIQHFEIRHGVPTDKDVYNTYFSGLTDNY